jgi:hypothetical protein
MIQIRKLVLSKRVKYHIDVDVYMYVGENANMRRYRFDEDQAAELDAIESDLVHHTEKYADLLYVNFNETKGHSTYVFEPVDENGCKRDRFDIRFRILKADYSDVDPSDEQYSCSVQKVLVNGVEMKDYSFCSDKTLWEDIFRYVKSGDYSRFRKRRFFVMNMYHAFIPKKVKYTINTNIYMYVGKDADMRSYRFSEGQIDRMNEVVMNLLSATNRHFTLLYKRSNDKKGYRSYVYQPKDIQGRDLPRFEMRFNLVKADYSSVDSPDKYNKCDLQKEETCGVFFTNILKQIKFVDEICEEISNNNYSRLQRR